MARFDRLQVLNEIVRIGVVPVFYHPDVEVAKKVVAACVAGGARVVEFTNRGDNAYRVFSDLVLHFATADPSVILGVGSVLDPATAALYISSGANFVVGSVLNPEVARVCNRRKIPYSPGCGSASEVSMAEELGVEIVKVFPGDSVGGPGFVKSLLGPTPWTRVMPTGGVEATRESILAWFKAGVAAVGVGSNLVRKEWLQAGNYEAITAKTAEILGWVREARGGNVFRGADPTKQMFSNFCQIGVVVRDLDRSMEALTQIFGLGPFRIVDWPPPGRPDIERYYHGEPACFTARMAFTELGPVELELIQPMEGQSIWADFLRDQGEGIHHLRFNVWDMEPVIEHLAGHGIAAAQMGSGIRPGTLWANFATESAVGFVIEVMKALPGTDGRTPALVDGQVRDPEKR